MTRMAPMLAAVGLGAVAGLRSLSAPALLARRLARRRRRRGGRGPIVRVLAGHTTARALEFGAAAELVADKMPGMPSRTEPLSLVGRAAAGALAGAAVTPEGGPQRLGAAALGAAAAVASANVAYRLRRAADLRLRVPDAAVGLVEDGVALAAGAGIVTAMYGD